ncbi:HNH endonuclease [Candidatus Dojkabacteria bacterium]|nr:HNH endonuclease [Candidatus Dojkabacteria bacterium]
METEKTNVVAWQPDDISFDKLSRVKKRILELLWKMEWVDGADIFQVVQQTYYDRRIRELRESGWQIETWGKKYRLISQKKLSGKVRTYPSAKQKQAVLERDKGICQICHVSDIHMQFDHKVPLERQGLTEVENLQLLCRTCNVGKRGICRHCIISTCDECPYAFPELYGNRFIVFLDEITASRAKSQADQRGLSESQILSEIVTQYYKDKPSKT